MTRPVNHRERIEGWLRDRLASRGPTVGYAVQMTGIKPMAGQGANALGWLIVITMKHPLLGTGDLYTPTHLPILAPDKETIHRVAAQALLKLDSSAAAIRSQVQNGAGTPGKSPGGGPGLAQGGPLGPGLPGLPPG
jgi:hypothetical protein